MLRLPGKQNNSVRYFYDGHSYHRDARGAGLTFRCATRGITDCPAVIYMQNVNNVEDQQVEVINHHNHYGDPLLYLRSKFMIDLKAIAQERAAIDEPRAIFDFVAGKDDFFIPVPMLCQYFLKRFPERNINLNQHWNRYEPLREYLDYHRSYKWRILRIINSIFPGTPRNLEELGEMLRDYGPMNEMYKGMAQKATDDSVSLIFIHNDMIQGLSQCSQLFCDGTFEIIPRNLGIAQVFIIHFRKLDAGFASIFVFCSSRTTLMYNAMWAKILEIVPALKNNVRSVMSDFERAQINSPKVTFPNATISGCSFHYKQSIAKKWETYNIEVQHEHVLEAAYALVHLPANRIAEGAMHITAMIDQLAETNDGPNLHKFGRYLRTFWVPLADIVSVYKQPVRTNNTCENFNLHAGKKLGSHPNVWKMLENLKKYVLVIIRNFRRAMRGLTIATRRPQRLIEADLSILEAEKDFEIGRYNVAELLLRISALRSVHFARSM